MITTTFLLCFVQIVRITAACGGERDSHSGCCLADPGCEFPQPQVDGGELGPGQRVTPMDGGAYRENRPVGHYTGNARISHVSGQSRNGSAQFWQAGQKVAPFRRWLCGLVSVVKIR